MVVKGEGGGVINKGNRASPKKKRSTIVIGPTQHVARSADLIFFLRRFLTIISTYSKTGREWTRQTGVSGATSATRPRKMKKIS